MLAMHSLPALLSLCSAFAGGAIVYYYQQKRSIRASREAQQRLEAERASGLHLTLSTAEALAYAIEARDPYNVGYLESVQRCVRALCRTLGLPEEEAAPLRVAALLHNIGRLGVPEHILLKPEGLTAEEREKLQTHPVLGARILASIPFPWPVVPIVRHHAEHWDGSGYPDGLRGSAIPFGARILAVASAYSALTRPRPYRPAYTPLDALAQIEARAGTQFDPAVVSAFRTVASELRAEMEAPDAGRVQTLPSQAVVSIAQRDARTALADIAMAQRETHSLLRLSQAVNASLHLEAVCDTLLDCTMELVPCTACVLFLIEDNGDFLSARAARGANARHLLGSVARVGTYLTGRAFSRGEVVQASFVAEDLQLREVSDPWTPLRSTLIVPLQINGESIGTLNLYSEEPEAFNYEALRLMRLISTQAARALDNARRFSDVQETAYTDAMTGLRNARYLREHLEREINRAQREGVSLAVLNIDVDNFKLVNDQLGHARGDQVLRDVAAILNAHVRNYDLVARYAGDEFVVVLAHADRIAAEVVATKLKVAVAQYIQRIHLQEPDFPQVGISVGIALYPEDGTDLQGLLCRSDAAMYHDKQSRRRATVSADRARRVA